ncbi:ribonucleoside-diphosphate reductase class II [Octadecabacter temperatus]|uniref:Vitamin B12-dependent ribonucleotide reductase n=1 Tax=Octadecabacter temperatus TaxID=1458307 RepID=A0A0K0Y6Y6_9RHOB|nr:adenosylcobalamin-dependent ribonucleoside-diphosphate reductase [Octadecabacter temperatus]AKS46632.1 Ribonucleoside-diphosphate reductase NrdZ [Octadecabacter temperatus]SIO18178.1 ribonucleoside-diphosphate reductase class II [Octadecabacter temperatus]
MYDVNQEQTSLSFFSQPIAERIWQTKYRYSTAGQVIDDTVQDTWERVARGLAEIEAPSDQSATSAAFLAAMRNFKVLPGGRILSGCGTKRNVTLSNTFVMRTIPDSVDGIMDTLKDAALTMQMGGGIGFDFSTIRPTGTHVRGLDCLAAGPLAAMDIFDTTCKMIVKGMGRGAMMATMRCDHPDIEAFIVAKSDRTRLRNFNLSVMVTDAFMDAVTEDDAWDLVWEGTVMRRLRARDLWNSIMKQTYATAEPGVLFIDRINAHNPLRYLETISATNSCAEQPLPPYGTCPLASVNLAQLVIAPFSPDARLDVGELRNLVRVAVRMLDNTLDVSRYALDAQWQQAQNQRRIGIGVTGVADAIAMLGARYGSAKAVFLLGSWMQTIQNAAYQASALLAKERGTFPHYDADAHLSGANIQNLDPEVQELVRKHGLRNGTLTTIAPTGTTSMFAGNVSSGVEPIFSTSFSRVVTNPDGTKSSERVMDFAAWQFSQMHGPDTPLPESFVTTADLTPQDHVAMQAAAQKWVDSGISKTVNCPEDIAFDDFKTIYRDAYNTGCKGCTTYRPNNVTGSILSL